MGTYAHKKSSEGIAGKAVLQHFNSCAANAV